MINSTVIDACIRYGLSAAEKINYLLPFGTALLGIWLTHIFHKSRNKQTLLEENKKRVVGWAGSGRTEDLSRIDLRKSDLRGIDLGVNPETGHGANLRFSDLRNCNLEGARLSKANLEGSNLSGSNLTDADLTDAILIEADLRGAILKGAILDGANVYKAMIYNRSITTNQISSTEDNSSTYIQWE